MNGAKRPYRAPRVTREGSFEELTKATGEWDKLVIFGMNGGAANLSAVS